MPPVPKRSDQRRRRNSKPAQKAAAGADVVIPDAPEHWGDLARDWFAGVAVSGQAQFYEQSDWAMAVAAGELLNEWQNCGRVTLITEWRQICTTLLLTEGDRRKHYLELEKAVEDDGRPKASELAKRRLGVAG